MSQFSSPGMSIIHVPESLVHSSDVNDLFYILGKEFKIVLSILYLILFCMTRLLHIEHLYLFCFLHQFDMIGRKL